MYANLHQSRNIQSDMFISVILVGGLQKRLLQFVFVSQNEHKEQNSIALKHQKQLRYINGHKISINDNFHVQIPVLKLPLSL